MKYKVGTSKIQGKGLIVKKPIKKGERIGTAHINGKPTSVVGKYHNHEDEPTAINVKEGNKRYLIADRDLMPGDEITTNYRLQPELEQPENFKKGGAVRLPKMPKPSKKGKLAKGYSRSLDATNKLFTEHVLFEKPKSKKNKVFDPSANYQEGGAPIPKGYQAALSQFVNPVVNETDENTGYNPAWGEINQDTRPGSIENNDWWMEHEKFHHLQNQSGASSSSGPAAQRPNNTTASDQAMGNYYNRRENEVQAQIDKMIAEDPDLQFIPREKLVQSVFPIEGEQPSFVGAGDLIYADPSTVEGEARAYEQYIRQGGKSVFPQKQNGGAPYNTDYDSIQEEADAANKSMMKARLAYADMHGNPAAKRMITIPDNPYQFEEGDTGTHFMASMGDYAVPQIQEENGSLMLGDYGPDSNEAIRFDDENDAQYFAENYKSVSPGFIETELSDDEIQAYRDGGYVVEEIDEPQYQDGGVYTHPGRPGAKYLKRQDGWYVQSPGKEGYVKVQDPQGNRTKELNKSAVLTDEVYALSPTQSNYINDSVPLNRAVSESTDTQASRNLTKSIEGRKVDESNRAIVQRANMRDGYRQNIENNPKLSVETKQKMLSEFNNLSPVDQNKSAYLALDKTVNPDQIKELKEFQPLGPSTWDILTNPFDAFKYSVVTGDVNNMPRNYNDAKMAGINMSARSYNERFNYGNNDGQGGQNMVGNFLNQSINPLDMGDKVYKYARKGDYLNAGLNLARFTPMLYTAPGAKVLDYLDDVGSAVGTVMGKSPLARFTNSSSSPFIQAVGKSLNADNLLTTKGITSGLLNLPNVANTGLQYYQTGKNKDLKNFAGEALKSAASLAPLSGSKVLSHINPYRTTYFGTKAGFDLMHKPEKEDAALGIPSLLRTFNRKEGGTVDTELTDEEIQNLIAEGYIIEELD